MRKHLHILILALFSLFAWQCTEKKAEPTTKPPISASEETPDSLRHCSAIAGMKSIERAVGVPTKYWQKNKVLRIGFLPGSTPAQIAFAKSCFAEFDDITNLSITYPETGPYDQRWGFDASLGAYSYIGTDCASISQTQRTGNIGWGWNTKDGTGKYTEGVARHEFGHAIGAMHEQCNGHAGICWIPANVYADLAKPPNNWDKPTVDFNVLYVCDTIKYQSTQWDKVSIMQYPIPARWTCSNTAIAGGQFLSTLDKAFWASVYPTAAPPPPPNTNVTITMAQQDSLLKWALFQKNDAAQKYEKVKAIFKK